MIQAVCVCVWNHTTLGNIFSVWRTRKNHIVFLIIQNSAVISVPSWARCLGQRTTFQLLALGRTLQKDANLFLFFQGATHQAHLFGLEPFTAYRIGVVAKNQAGEVASPWTLVQTPESSPSGLSNFTVEQKENGRALLLQWSEPVRTNGVIQVMSTLKMQSCLVFSG